MTRPETVEALAKLLERRRYPILLNDFPDEKCGPSNLARRTEARDECAAEAAALLDAIDAGQVPGLVTSDLLAEAKAETLQEARDDLYAGYGPDFVQDSDVIYGEWLSNRADRLHGGQA